MLSFTKPLSIIYLFIKKTHLLLTELTTEFRSLPFYLEPAIQWYTESSVKSVAGIALGCKCSNTQERGSQILTYYTILDTN